MQWNDFVERIQERGQYPAAEEAERVTRIVLSALGGHLPGPEREELARRLPPEAAAVLTAGPRVTAPLTAAWFVDSVAARIEGATPATARWDTSSVLTAVADLIGDDLLDRVIGRLPAGYALLFGRAQLMSPPSAPAAPQEPEDDRALSAAGASADAA